MKNNKLYEDVYFNSYFMQLYQFDSNKNNINIKAGVKMIIRLQFK